MLFLRIAMFSALMRMNSSSQDLWDFSLGSFINSPTHSKLGKGEENTTLELHRRKHQDNSSEYMIAVEITFADASLQEDLRKFFKNLNFPLSVNISDSDVNISHINITTVCNSSAPNHSRCFCEPGYGWAAKICEAYPACPNTAPALGKSCNCIGQFPPEGAFCHFQPEVHITKMSVRLNIPFENALWDSSSELFKQYKQDLEKAFNDGYASLPGFINVTVTGFRPGSTMVHYEITSARQIPLENAHPQIAAVLAYPYHLAASTFATEMPGKVNISVSPEHIFEGDTVKISCKIESTSRQVIWSYNDISRDRFSVMEEVKDGNTIATLKITNIRLNEADNFSCSFKDSSDKLPSIYRGDANIMVSQIKLVPSENVSIVCNGADRKELSCCTDRDIHFFSPYWRPNGAINISGSITSINNCTTYQLQASESQCPADKSGTSTDYTCELNTTYGARTNKIIKVTYFRVAKVTLSSSKHIVSEGDPFSLTCQSDVSNYDKVTWEIQDGNTIKEIDNMWHITTKSSTGAKSVLSIPSANKDWSGTYKCTFFQSFLSSSGNTTIKVIPLLWEQEIIRDPIETIISCPATRKNMECCTSRMENYTVHFASYYHNMPLQTVAERRKKDHLNCYYYTQNFTEVHCKSKGQVLQVHCTFVNQLNRNVTSPAMVLKFVPAQNVTCNSSDIGVGANEAQITKPCSYVDEANNSVRGNITFKCNHTKWTVDTNSCLSVPINHLLSSAESLASGPQSQKNLPTFLTQLNQTTHESHKEINNSAANLKAVLETLTLISVIPVDAKQENMANFGSTVETVINTPTETWNSIKNGSSQLLASVEQFLGSLQPVNETVPSITFDRLQIKGAVLGKNNVSIYSNTFTFPQSAGLSGSVLIDEATFDVEESITIVSVAYPTIEHIIPQSRKEVVNGLVMTTVINPKIRELFQIKMIFTKHEKAMKKPRCVFWNFTLAEGAWDDTGCSTKDDGESVSCSCNHTTSFAILMSPHQESSPDELTYITYIGLSVSILGLVACIGIEFLVWKSVTKTRIAYMRHVCILNIAVSLLVADICFIVVAAMQDTNEAVDGNLCTAATFLIHFFFLCVFFWMLTLGLMLFYHLVFLLHNASKTIMKAVGFGLGYICPLLISVITIASTLPYSSYTRKRFCFLNWEESKALLALVIPAMSVVAVNTVVTIVVIAKISRRSIGEKSMNEEKSSLYRLAKSIGVLTPLLGLTWGFGLATVVPGSHITFHVLFTVFNAFQGLFILLCGTLWDRKVREAMWNKYSFSRWSSQHSKSLSQGLSAPMLSINSPFSRTVNNLFGKAGKYQVSSTESSSVSSENSSKAYSLLT